MKKITQLILSSTMVLLSACAPEVGSDAWCKDMSEKEPGDWSANEATEFARNCVFKTYDEE